MNKKLLNAEGYYDPTAYMAVYKGNHDMEWRDGDIIKKIGYGGREAVMIVVKAHKNYATTLPLFDRESNENEFRVLAGTPMHADLGKIRYTPKRDIEEAEFVRTMDDSEYRSMIIEIAKVLGAPCEVLEYKNDGIDEIAKVLGAPCEVLEYKNDGIDERVMHQSINAGISKEQMDKMLLEGKMHLGTLAPAPKDDGMAEKIIKVTAERDVYKKICNELIKRVGYQKYDVEPAKEETA